MKHQGWGSPSGGSQLVRMYITKNNGQHKKGAVVMMGWMEALGAMKGRWATPVRTRETVTSDTRETR